jgi:hypothetical protein
MASVATAFAWHRHSAASSPRLLLSMQSSGCAHDRVRSCMRLLAARFTPVKLSHAEDEQQERRRPFLLVQ